MQDDAKFVTHAKLVDSFIDYNHEGNRIRYVWEDGFVAEAIATSIEVAAADGFQFFYVGLPSAHLVHNQDEPYRHLACDVGGEGLTYDIETNLKQLAMTSGPNITFGSGMPTTRPKELVCKNADPTGADCKAGACDYSTDNRGV